MATKTTELNQILETLDTLQSRVQELTADNGGVDSVTAPPEAAPEVDRLPADVPAALPGGMDAAAVALLRDGINELTTMGEFKTFPQFFEKLAARTGLRMVLLKKWTSGLQVFLTENIKLPAEARKKRSDGRAPIPTARGDIFEATATEATVYAGPVPVKHFPLDLTLMLGRGSRDRQIVILPLPSQGHWNTFIYLDADEATEKALVAAEVLAQFALARMLLLAKGVRARHGRVAGILKSEMHRRRKSQALRLRRGLPTEPAADGDDGPAVRQTPLASDAPEIDPFVVQESAPEEPEPPAPAPRPRRKLKLAPADAPVPGEPEVAAEPAPKTQVTADALPDAPDWDPADGPARNVTPEDVLHGSGELPALPRAACHIMAVIEDPRTTATKLESALAMDQALTAKVLRIANSPFYGAVREIKTVSEAIVRLGFVAIRNWTLVTAARSVFLAPGAGMLYQKIWRQSVMSAMAGQLVAQVVGRADPEAVFIGGLMQNIGQLVLARAHPELFQEILTVSTDTGRPYHEVERELLGFDHGALGALLIREWNLSEDLEKAVRWHHDFTNDEAENAQVAAMIALGEEIALTSAAGDEDEGPQDHELQPAGEAARFLGITSARVEELRTKAQELQIDPHFFS